MGLDTQPTSILCVSSDALTQQPLILANDGWDHTAVHTLRASLSGIFLQTLPELFYIYLYIYLLAAVHRRCQRSPKDLSANKTVEAEQHPSTHVS